MYFYSIKDNLRDYNLTFDFWCKKTCIWNHNYKILNSMSYVEFQWIHTFCIGFDLDSNFCEWYWWNFFKHCENDLIIMTIFLTCDIKINYNFQYNINKIDVCFNIKNKKSIKVLFQCRVWFFNVQFNQKCFYYKLNDMNKTRNCVCYDISINFYVIQTIFQI